MGAAAPSLDCGFSTIFRSLEESEYGTQARRYHSADAAAELRGREGRGGQAAEVYECVLATQARVSRHFDSIPLVALGSHKTQHGITQATQLHH